MSDLCTVDNKRCIRVTMIDMLGLKRGLIINLRGLVIVHRM